MPFRMRQRPESPVDRATPDAVPAGLKIAGVFSWNLLLVVAILVVVGVVIIRLQDVVVPFLIAIILSALLVPLARWLQRHRWPKWLAILSSWIVVLAALAAMTTIVTAQVRYDIPSLRSRIQTTVNSAKTLLASHPFGITGAQLDKWVNDGTNYLQAHASTFASGFAAAGTSAIHVFEGLFIIIFTTLFVLIDGGRIWAWVLRVFPRRARFRLDAAGQAGWRTLTSFVRVQLIVAVTDGVGVGLGSFLTGVPLAVPIGVIVFLGAFVPVVGAIVAGIFAVVVALVFNGWVQALIVLGIVVLVQELESHVLHPFLTGSAVKVHPLGIVLGVTAGSSIAGIVGAFFAVPFIATANAMIVAAAHADPDEITGAGHDPDPEARRIEEPRSRR